MRSWRAVYRAATALCAGRRHHSAAGCGKLPGCPPRAGTGYLEI